MSTGGTDDEKRSGDNRPNLLGRLVGCFTGCKADGEGDLVVLVPNGEAIAKLTMTIGRLNILNARWHASHLAAIGDGVTPVKLGDR
jgi:hypothetical protein